MTALSKEPSFPVVSMQGVDGMVIRFSDRLTEPANRAALALSHALSRGAVADVAECSSALASVYVRFLGDLETGRRCIEQLLKDEDFTAAELPDGRRLWRIPTAFGGESGSVLSQVVTQIGVSERDAIRDLTNTRLRVQAIGFAPGQPYLGQLNELWDLPRLNELVNVPKGTIAVAIRQLVLFANDSPTGWQPVGRTGFRCFRPQAERPFPLSPGDEVLLTEVSDGELDRIISSDPTGDGGAVSERIP